MKPLPRVPKTIAPGPLLGFLRDLCAWILEDRVITSNDVVMNDSAGGRLPQVQVRAGGAAGGRVVAHPFRVSVRTVTANDVITRYRIVEYRSALITALYPYDTEVISGLATVDEPDTEDDGWAELIANDTIWLEIEFVAGVIDTVAIKSFGAGDEWESGELSEYSGTGTTEDPYVQTFARCVIATTIADANGNPRLIQKIHSDLVLATWDAQGRAGKIPVPLAGAL